MSSLSSAIDVFDFVYNPKQKLGLLAFDGLFNTPPNLHARFSLHGSFCEIRRNRREILRVRIDSPKIIEALNEASEIHVAETDNDGVMWDYKIKKIR